MYNGQDEKGFLEMNLHSQTSFSFTKLKLTKERILPATRHLHNVKNKFQTERSNLIGVFKSHDKFF